MTLLIPTSVILADGSLGQVKRVSASVAEGAPCDVIYVVETPGGAWVEVPAEGVRAGAEQ